MVLLVKLLNLTHRHVTVIQLANEQACISSEYHNVHSHTHTHTPATTPTAISHQNECLL